MYVHNQDWTSAARVAREHDPESVNDVLLGQARIAFSERNFAQAEALLLRAQRPDMAVRAYRETGHWEDAIRVAQAYLPSKLQELLVRPISFLPWDFCIAYAYYTTYVLNFCFG